MKLSISNIAWSADRDNEIYEFLSENGIQGLEIAPTRIFSVSPYEHLDEAKTFSLKLQERYGISISSMQSIWYGVTESIFTSEIERQCLFEYTQKAIDFAVALHCPNLVFGCPKNRTIPPDINPDAFLPVAYDFFNRIGNYGNKRETYISIEPNPPIYNTNFINTTQEAFDICKKINNQGIGVNIDLGTMIHYSESFEMLKENINLINHIHISEPHLALIKRREMHKKLINVLCGVGYEKFLSIEMKSTNDIHLIKDTILYIKELCDDI